MINDEKAPAHTYASAESISVERRETGKKASSIWLAKNLLHLLNTGLEDTITVAEIQSLDGEFSYSGTNYTRLGEQCGQFKSKPVLVEKDRLSFLYDNSSSVTAHFAMGTTTMNFFSIKRGRWTKYHATAKDSVRKVISPSKDIEPIQISAEASKVGDLSRSVRSSCSL